MIDYISIPKRMTIPASWTETPEQEEQDKVDKAAQSYFANWEEDSLGQANLLLNVGKVVAVLGCAASICFVSIPGVILCGASLTVCFIGSNAIWREQVERCKKACLQLENWCNKFNQVAEALAEKIEQLAEKGIDDDFELDEEIKKEIVKLVDELPSNDLKSLADDLNKHHEQVFGETRSIGSRTWSDYWISNYLGCKCRLEVDHFYISIGSLRDTLQEENEHMKITLKILLRHLLPYFVENEEKKQKKESEIDIRTRMLLISGGFDAPPQGTDYFPTLIDEVEYWRQNVAIFRSSLLRL